jgi:hypothetical protein
MRRPGIALLAASAACVLGPGCGAARSPGAAGPDPRAEPDAATVAAPEPAHPGPEPADTSCVPAAASAALVVCERAAAGAALPADAAGLAEAAEARGRAARGAGDLIACTGAFDEAARLWPDPTRAADAAYEAVLCVMQAQSPPTSPHTAEADARRERRGAAPSGDEASRLLPRELSPAAETALRVMERYLCLAPDGEDALAVAYRRARIYYEANHFGEAAVLFHDIAGRGVDHEIGEFAANLYLDSVNELGTVHGERRDACMQDLSAGAEELSGLYCAPPASPGGHEELCFALTTIRCQIRARSAARLADAGAPAQAAEALLALLAEEPDCAYEGTILENAATYLESSGQPERAAEMRARARSH